MWVVLFATTVNMEWTSDGELRYEFLGIALSSQIFLTACYEEGRMMRA